MALTTYTDTNLLNAPVTQTVIDSGTATVPSLRPSVFTPLTGYAAATSALDYAVSTTTAPRLPVFEPPTVSVTLDPGLAVDG